MTQFRECILAMGEETPMHALHFLIRQDTTAQFGPWNTADASPSMQNRFSLAPYFGVWSHVATLYDPVDKTLKTYINGILAAENALSDLDLHAGDGVSIGTRIRRGFPLLEDSNYLGRLDEIRIYDRVLPESVIRWEYATQRENSSVVKPR